MNMTSMQVISRRRRVLSAGLLSLLLLALPQTVFAGIVNPIGCESIQECLTLLVRQVLLLVGVLAVGFIIYGGFQYIMAAGNDDQIRAGKRTIVSAIVGIIFIGLAYAIVEFVFQALGGSGGPGGPGGNV